MIKLLLKPKNISKHHWNEIRNISSLLNLDMIDEHIYPSYVIDLHLDVNQLHLAIYMLCKLQENILLVGDISIETVNNVMNELSLYDHTLQLPIQYDLDNFYAFSEDFDYFYKHIKVNKDEQLGLFIQTHYTSDELFSFYDYTMLEDYMHIGISLYELIEHIFDKDTSIIEVVNFIELAYKNCKFSSNNRYEVIHEHIYYCFDDIIDKIREITDLFIPLTFEDYQVSIVQRNAIQQVRDSKT